MTAIALGPLRETKTCALPSCGATFPFSFRSERRKRYCNTVCAANAGAIQRRALQARTSNPLFLKDEPRPRRTCEHCRQHFVASARDQRFCNIACSTQAVANKRRGIGT